MLKLTFSFPGYPFRGIGPHFHMDTSKPGSSFVLVQLNVSASENHPRLLTMGHKINFVEAKRSANERNVANANRPPKTGGDYADQGLKWMQDSFFHVDTSRRVSHNLGTEKCSGPIMADSYLLQLSLDW